MTVLKIMSALQLTLILCLIGLLLIGLPLAVIEFAFRFKLGAFQDNVEGVFPPDESDYPCMELESLL